MMFSHDQGPSHALAHDLGHDQGLSHGLAHDISHDQALDHVLAPVETNYKILMSGLHPLKILRRLYTPLKTRNHPPLDVFDTFRKSKL